MTNRFVGHPVGVAKQLAKVRTREERERRCIESLLCGLTDEEFENATRVEAIYFIDDNQFAYDSLKLIDAKKTG